jgi:hypothetical protein
MIFRHFRAIRNAQNDCDYRRPSAYGLDCPSGCQRSPRGEFLYVIHLVLTAFESAEPLIKQLFGHIRTLAALSLLLGITETFAAAARMYLKSGRLKSVIEWKSLCEKDSQGTASGRFGEEHASPPRGASSDPGGAGPRIRPQSNLSQQRRAVGTKRLD